MSSSASLGGTIVSRPGGSLTLSMATEAGTQAQHCYEHYHASSYAHQGENEGFDQAMTEVSSPQYQRNHALWTQYPELGTLPHPAVPSPSSQDHSVLSFEQCGPRPDYISATPVRLPLSENGLPQSEVRQVHQTYGSELNATASTSVAGSGGKQDTMEMTDESDGHAPVSAASKSSGTIKLVWADHLTAGQRRSHSMRAFKSTQRRGQGQKGRSKSKVAGRKSATS
ncbi:hypothetical protein BD324DRAFT_650928 [Kockovaella imperatae]|uniref:Uncharacterized protein n=1 Tax=Kockovaella imperatae TaxID=4999 RepID=A0A1Y1UH07_9TREE|nr:hypothetical protein BD324DRAFT_650928 [Kockovaella imperatae]ORX37328.1 hypothetical protein BD324DRAFT_650928 [Kockovaella imperatae]